LEEYLASIFRIEERAKQETRRPMNQAASKDFFWFIFWFTLQPSRWMRHVSPKHRLTFSGLYGFTPQTTELFSTIPVSMTPQDYSAASASFAVWYIFT
jgi:hypothetical protein